MLVLRSISLKTNLHRHTVLHTLRLLPGRYNPRHRFSASPCRQRKALPECPPHRGGPVRPGGSGGQRISGLSAVHSVRGGSVGGPGRGCRLQGSSSGQWGQPRPESGRWRGKPPRRCPCPAAHRGRSERAGTSPGLLFQSGHPTGAGRNLRGADKCFHNGCGTAGLMVFAFGHKKSPYHKKKADL